MNKSSISAASVMIMLLAGIFNLNAAQAMGSKSTDISNSEELTVQQPYVWYDGDRERTVWLNPQLVVEFNPSEESRSAFKTANSSAEEIPFKQGSIRLWKLSKNVTARTTIQSLKSMHANAKSRYSPVLQDGPSNSGRMRALPGNIIIHLDPSWEQVAVDTWLEKNKLVVVRKLNIGPNIFVIKTDSGLASLEIANKFHESGEVVAAYPDWWTEVATR
ncbi:MAG: hypothetical protein GXP19_07170 [Gammaproteobacteria bacterium]|nr:hypothetical protein [Gammaproteobacteria bacterium]